MVLMDTFMELIVLDDLCGIHLWGENIFRRVLHHFSGNNYNPNKQPLVFHVPMIKEETVHEIQQLSLPEKRALNTTYFGKIEGQYSTKSTLYYHDFDTATQMKLVSIGEKLIPQLESLVHEKLTMGNSDFKAMILRYEGKESKFDMHYDAEHPDCYRVLILYQGGGIIPPFCYMDQGLQKIHLKEGEGIFFKGSQTYHGVFPSGNENTLRYMLGFQYQKQNTREQKSFCSELRRSSLGKIALLLVPYGMYYQLLSHIAYVTPPLMISIAMLSIGYRYSVYFGAYPYSIKSITQFYFFILLCTANPLLSFHVLSYFLFTELFVSKHNPSTYI
jgi:hypothetical protein